MAKKKPLVPKVSTTPKPQNERIELAPGGLKRNGVFEPTVSAQSLVEPKPKTPFTAPKPAALNDNSSRMVKNVAGEVDGIITANTAEAQRLKELRDEQAGFGINSAQMFEDRLKESGVDVDMTELKDIKLQLADMQTESELRKTRITGADGQTYNQGLREVNQEDREEAVRQTGLAARAAVLTDNINTATALAKEAVGYAFQDATLEFQNRKSQIDDLRGTVDQQTQQLLDAQLREIEAEEARIKEVKDAVQAAILAGASQADITSMLSVDTPDEQKLALAQSVIGQTSREDRALDRAAKGASIRASNANAALNEFALEKEQAIADAVASGAVILDGDQQKTAMSLGKQFEDESKGFKTQVDAYNRIMASADEPSAAGDLALIFSYMKILDPGSVVRETEFANAQNAAGVPERIRAQYNKVLNGERLSASTRTDFVDRAGSIYSSALDQQVDLENQFRQQGTDVYGLPAGAVELIVRDIRASGAVSDTAFGLVLNNMSDDQLTSLMSSGLLSTPAVAQ